MVVDQAMQAALNGTLVSPNGNMAGGYFLLNNELPVPLYLYMVDEVGNQALCLDLATGTVPLLFAANAATLCDLYTDVYYVARTAYSGAFVALLITSMQGTASRTNAPIISITPANLISPNQIGKFPTPNENMPLPPDSPRILVGAGTTPTSPPGVMTREQYWERAPDSYLLAPGTKRTVSTTLTSGLQKTSSHQGVIAESLGMSASAGWGPISASVSANLSVNSTDFQQVFVSSETNQYESLTLQNKTNYTQLFLRWQLTDVITVFQAVQSPPAPKTPRAITMTTQVNGPGGMVPVASLSIAESPTLIGGPYNPDQLPPVALVSPRALPAVGKIPNRRKAGAAQAAPGTKAVRRRRQA